MRCASPPESVEVSRSSDQIVEADFVEESQALADLFQNFVGDGGLLGAECQLSRKTARASVTVIAQTSVMDLSCTRTARASARKSRAVAFRAQRVSAIAAEKYAHVQLVLLALQPGEKSFHAGIIRVADRLRQSRCAARRSAGERERPMGILAPARIASAPATARGNAAWSRARSAPSWMDLPAIGNDQIEIEVDGIAESLAARARAVWIVERK